MLVFSSAQITKSFGPNGCPSQIPAYRSSTRAAKAHEVGVPDRDPGPVLPGLEGIVGEPAAHGGHREPHLGSGRPVRGPVPGCSSGTGAPRGGRQLTGQRDHLRADSVRQPPRPSGARGVPQPRQPAGDEPFAPLADGVHAHPDLPGDRRVGVAVVGGQHDAGPDSGPGAAYGSSGPGGTATRRSGSVKTTTNGLETGM